MVMVKLEIGLVLGGFVHENRVIVRVDSEARLFPAKLYIDIMLLVVRLLKPVKELTLIIVGMPRVDGTVTIMVSSRETSTVLMKLSDPLNSLDTVVLVEVNASPCNTAP